MTQDQRLEKLIVLLKRINSGQIILIGKFHSVTRHKYYFNSGSKKYTPINESIFIESYDTMSCGYAKEIGALAKKLFTIDRSVFKVAHLSKIKRAGFDIFPIEEDEYGWLIAGIKTNQGVILFKYQK